MCYSVGMRKYTFTTSIQKEGAWYVAYCVELGVASQGKTLAEAKKNIKEAVELYLEDTPARKLPNNPVVSKLEIVRV